MKITSVTFHPKTPEAARAIAPLVKHLQSLSEADLRRLARQAKKVQARLSELDLAMKRITKKDRRK